MATAEYKNTGHGVKTCPLGQSVFNSPYLEWGANRSNR